MSLVALRQVAWRRCSWQQRLPDRQPLATVAWALLLLTGLAAVPPSVHAGAAKVGHDQAHVEQLIRQLGQGSYSARRQATKELVDIGVDAQPQLTIALEDDDAEVRSRAAQILALVIDADFHARLQAFANDTAGRGGYMLPCWDQYRAVFGEDRPARDLFVELQRCEPELLDTLEQDPKLASEMLAARIQTLAQNGGLPQFASGANAQSVAVGSICALLFTGSQPSVEIGEQDALQLSELVSTGALQSTLRSSVQTTMLKKLLGRWIVRDNGSVVAFRNLSLALTLDLKEGLDVAIRLIGNDKNPQPGQRQVAILAIGRFGNHEQIPLIEPLLNDTHPCMPQQNDPKFSQIRDVALAVLIKLSGQELKDYGLDHVQHNSLTLYQPGTVTFGDPAKREVALQKWAEWSQHPMLDTPAPAPAADATPSPRSADEAPAPQDK